MRKSLEFLCWGLTMENYLKESPNFSLLPKHFMSMLNSVSELEMSLSSSIKSGVVMLLNRRHCTNSYSSVEKQQQRIAKGHSEPNLLQSQLYSR